ncbi:flavodoxin [Bifidobacterium panos]|uniref:Flavodoxin n=1 Tax=Bifidobacterium panos TaxID=2675321 RepID=A0ABX1SZN5_9BIFI|nr:flavodoxin [Bifidobacterium sp. DSM 109963]NMN02612.1 flavodoxin [Bifidobacterium sp. DSM 109963]
MKKICALFMGLLLMFGLAACGNNQQTGNEGDMTANNQAGSQTSPNASEKGKTLVAYFSASGNTEAVASVIANKTSGELFKLEPAEAYSSDDLDWTKSTSRVNKEHENESERDIKLVSASVDNWDEYDTVFIGYPIWWGIAAWPVNEFVTANDFTGKTVIPFCTSASSGIGESGELLAKMAGTGNWQSGQRFRSSASDSDVTSWLDQLSY